MRRSTPKTTTENCMYFPVWNELFTFSTGFSTVFVKKKRSFPRCFPLFPPGFPHPVKEIAIHGVMEADVFCKVLGENVGIVPFIKKKVEGFSLYFTVSKSLRVCFSPIWNVHNCSFPHLSGYKTFLWKSGGKRWFSTTKIACIPKDAKRPSAPECRRPLQIVTSYCGTPAARSGSTGSSCKRPRWW